MIHNGQHSSGRPCRLRIVILGAVQGVGFRPFIYRLATERGLAGWVKNSEQGVVIEVEGAKENLDAFVIEIEKEKPPRSFIQSLECSFLDPVGYKDFVIRPSSHNGTSTALIMPDVATCSDCLQEVLDPQNRRFLYPFTNCTNCGPRFSIIERLPYDRINTTMRKFGMCDRCRSEYEDPADRRFHAQPNACPTCGPHLELWDADGKALAAHHDAMMKTVDAIRSGLIVAIKGIGGFHLMVDARNDEAVTRLRRRKHREEKPFALMFPSIESVKEECEVSGLEERLLLSPESPIVLLDRISHIAHRTSDNPNPQSPPQADAPPAHEIRNLRHRRMRLRRTKFILSSSIAPNNPTLGIMLPSTPLHHILMKALGFPVVATSGNLSDEPICIDEVEALERLRGVADLFLVHDRPIRRPIDDSIVRMMMGRELVLRRGRGYAPLPVNLGKNQGGDSSVLSVGAQLKNTIALSSRANIFISQHLGNLDTPASCDAFQAAVDDLRKMYGAGAPAIACDMHPDYYSTKYAQNLGVRVVGVQHHYAHVASCMAENQLDGRVLGVSWDGTGYGLDGTIWGGEFLLTNESSFDRVATLRRFRLPGGEKAIREPRRTALGLLYELYGNDAFEMDDLAAIHSLTAEERIMLRQMLNKGVNSPLTSSAGRLFDAVASIIGLRQRMSFEGQAAMELEFLTASCKTDNQYPFQILSVSDKKGRAQSLHPGPRMIVHWGPLVHQIVEDVRMRVAPAVISTKFHNTLSEIIVEIAGRIGEERVLLTGGCFQNRYLTERTIRRLEAEGFHPYWHQRVPPNDGGIALGQIYAVIRSREKRAEALTQPSRQVEAMP